MDTSSSQHEVVNEEVNGEWEGYIYTLIYIVRARVPQGVPDNNYD